MVRGGTKDYHGGAYEFNRNDRYAARDAFKFPRPIPDRDSLKTPYRYNNFGYNFGGPFFIPKVYPHSKSRTFFFWSEEWRRVRQSSVLASADLVPTANERNGIFSAAIKNPAGGTIANNT